LLTQTEERILIYHNEKLIRHVISETQFDIYVLYSTYVILFGSEANIYY